MRHWKNVSRYKRNRLFRAITDFRPVNDFFESFTPQTVFVITSRYIWYFVGCFWITPISKSTRTVLQQIAKYGLRKNSFKRRRSSILIGYFQSLRYFENTRHVSHDSTIELSQLFHGKYHVCLTRAYRSRDKTIWRWKVCFVISRSELRIIYIEEMIVDVRTQVRRSLSLV